MFASKRCKLVKRLWEESAKLVKSYYASSQPPLCAAASPTVNYEAFCSLEDRKAVESMLKHLCVPQLQTMLQAVQTKGRDGCDCLLLPHHDVKLLHEVVAPHVLCCRLWRWPQLRHDYELRRLPWCADASPPKVCCNPYHWSIVQKPESPPPPYSLQTLEESYLPIESSPPPPYSFQSMADACSSPFGYSATTPVVDCTAGPVGEASGDDGEPWCRIAYWELNERVGDLYSVQRPWLHVTFDECAPSSAREEALRLHSLAGRSSSPGAPCKEELDVVRTTRAKIGQGLTLLHERDGVWLYNRSQHAVFVASPTLDVPTVRNLTVFKVLPGYCLRVFDWERARFYRSIPSVSWDGPYAPNVARISFVKGWGPNYVRQVVTALPCSLELFFRTTPPPPR
ncbi:mothers against decapentaplegic homolog 6-like [Dermacentor variabilis]|uniref:mothers against decapentaplegic homolog 6-like n=1 Tax=Dermacentor variabilis TaxID=34621 RepID=UPI003F5C4CB7